MGIKRGSLQLRQRIYFESGESSEEIDLIGLTLDYPLKEVLFVMDNTGGHMTNDAIDEYVQLFSEKYNIGTIVQVSCFPFKMYQA